MRYGKLLPALFAMLALGASGAAWGHGGHFGGGHAAAVGPGHGSGMGFHGGSHFAGRRHGGHGGGFIFFGAPLFLPGYAAVPSYDPPAAYISQDNPNPVWYYCDNPRGYYPTVIDCPGGWQAVGTDALPR